MPENPNIQRWLFAISVLLIAVLVVWQGLTPPVSSVQKDVLELKQASAQVKGDKDITLVSPGGEARVYVPCCTLKDGGMVNLVMRDSNLFQDPAGMETWSRPLIANLEYLDETGKRVPGTDSSSPLEICFQLTDEEWFDYLSAPVDMQIQQYDETAIPKAWTAVKTYSDTETHSLCSQIKRLSIYSLAVKDIPIPATGQKGIYNP